MKLYNPKITLYILAGFLVALVAAVPSLRPTRLSAIHLSCSDCTTATPVLMVNQDSTGKIFELLDASTPVWSVNDGGSITQAGGETNSSNLVVSAPTAVGTATPAVLINNAGVSKQIEIQDGGTVAFDMLNGGGARFTAPTAIATAQPGLVADTSGVSNIFEVRANATPQFQVDASGLVDLHGNQLDLDADNDTSITADTDDQIDFEIAGTDQITISTTSLFLNGTLINQDAGTENLGQLPTVCSATITYTAAAGGSGTVCSIGASEIWYIHAVFAEVTTNWDATGDDALVEIGDGNDADGLLDLDDGELQAADTEGTGAPAGWQGFMSTDTRGAYLANGHGFIYNPGSAETIDYNIDETSGETLSAGQLTVYVVYTRLQ